MSIDDVLLILRALFAAQIDRESNDAREYLLRQIVDALTVDNVHARTAAALHRALTTAALCGDPQTEARAVRASKAIKALEALDELLAHDRETALAAMFARTGEPDDPRRPGDEDGETRRTEAAGT